MNNKGGCSKVRLVQHRSVVCQTIWSGVGKSPSRRPDVMQQDCVRNYQCAIHSRSSPFLSSDGSAGDPREWGHGASYQPGVH